MVKYRNSLGFVIVFSLLAILLRIILVNWTLQFWNNGDLVRYQDWARVSHIYGLADTYKPTHVKTIVNNEPPGSLYIISGTYETYILIGKMFAKITHTLPGSNVWVNTLLDTILMKTPAIITDLLMGVLAYLLVIKEKGRKRALLSASLIWFNPVIFYNSAIWGQMDSLNNFFFVLSLFLAFRKNFLLSLISFVFSVYIKFSLLPLLPFYGMFLYFLSEKKWKILIIDALVTMIIFILTLLPISQNPIVWLVNNMPIFARGEYQNIVIVAFNFWWAVTCLPFICTNNLPVVNQLILWIPLQVWAYILFTASTLPLLYLQIKNYNNLNLKKNVFLLFALLSLCIFLFLPRMHDRYMYPVFPLFAIAIGFSDRVKKYLYIFIGLTIIHIFNLLGSWYPTYFPVFFIYQLLYSSVLRWIVSILTLFLAGWFYIKALKEFRQ